MAVVRNNQRLDWSGTACTVVQPILGCCRRHHLRGCAPHSTVACRSSQVWPSNRALQSSRAGPFERRWQPVAAVGPTADVEVGKGDGTSRWTASQKPRSKRLSNGSCQGAPKLPSNGSGWGRTFASGRDKAPAWLGRAAAAAATAAAAAAAVANATVAPARKPNGDGNAAVGMAADAVIVSATQRREQPTVRGFPFRSAELGANNALDKQPLSRPWQRLRVAGRKGGCQRRGREVAAVADCEPWRRDEPFGRRSP
jgi:hypothetical protein